MNPVPAGNLLAYLAQVSDPRGRQGLRHSLEAMLATVVCAVLCGARGYTAIAEWIHAQDVKTWHCLGYWRKPPTRNAFRNLLLKLVPEELETAVRQWAGARGLITEDRVALLAHPALRAELQRSVDAVNAEVSRVVQIKRFAVLPQDWTSDTGELTPTLKVRRQVVLEKYATEVDALYAEH